MLKSAGHPCPNCNAVPCAEYAQKDEAPRWTCNGCGASGDLSGTFTARGKAAAKGTAQSKPHWKHKRAA